MDRRDFLKLLGGGMLGAAAARLLGGLPDDEPRPADGPLGGLSNVYESYVPASDGVAGLRSVLTERDGFHTVRLGPGTFELSDNLTIPSRTMLVGAGRYATRLRFADNTPSLSRAGLIRFEDCERSGIRSLELDGNRQNNRESDTHKYGVYTKAASTIEVADCYVHDFTGYGIDPHEKTEAVTIRNNLVERNGYGSGEERLIQRYDGITLDGCFGVSVTGNITRNNARHGINIVTSTRKGTIADNLVMDNGAAQMAVQHPGTQDLNIHSNTITGGTHGIRIGNPGTYIGGIWDGDIDQPRSITITANTIQDTNQHGIYIRGARMLSISDNQLTNTGNTDASSIRVEDISTGGTQHRCRGIRLLSNTLRHTNGSTAIQFDTAQDSHSIRDNIARGYRELLTATTPPQHRDANIHLPGTPPGPQGAP